MPEASAKLEEYFLQVKKGTEYAFSIAEKARKKGYDPEKKVDIPLARNLAERVEGLISAEAPQLLNSGMSERICELEKEFSAQDWRVGFMIAEEVAKEKFCSFESKIKALEIGIRVGFAYLTNGIVSAPLEGFIELKLKKRKDSGEYFSVCYAGPIRGAGGTAAATSVILADFVRKRMGYAAYDPQESEVKRYVAEIADYNERVTNLQYLPSNEEIAFMASHLPVEINGDPTETIDVSNFKDLERVETNAIRGGVCLVMAEGLCQKASKLWKRLNNFKEGLGMEHWDFMEDFLKLQKEIKARKKDTKASASSKKSVSPNYTFIADMVAGRPILSLPLANGGFRLRYGRSRITGFSATGINPATLRLLNNYIATGTQLKVERPGKGASVLPIDSIDGPVVLLHDGSVFQIDAESQVKAIEKNVKTILYLGDILFNYGDFSENGQTLVPAGYCPEWWAVEVEKAMVDTFGALDMEKLSSLINMLPEAIDALIKDPFYTSPSFEAAKAIGEKLHVPLHPKYNYFFSSISAQQLLYVMESLSSATIHASESGEIIKIVLPMDHKAKEIMELLALPHHVTSNEFIVLEKAHAKSISYLFHLLDKDQCEQAKTVCREHLDSPALQVVNLFSPVKVKDRAGTFIGVRMGRPEKAKMRKLLGSPQVLFPVGEEGGKMRSFQAALEGGKVTAAFPIYFSEKTGNKTIYPVCEISDEETKRLYFSKVEGDIATPIDRNNEKSLPYSHRTIDIKYYFEAALKKLKMKAYPDLIKGVKGTSNRDHIPENIVKGILRAKYDIYVNKDGTTRYDMSEEPITHFKPREISTSLEKLRELGYVYDIYKQTLIDDEQIVEIFPQDVILPGVSNSLDESAADVLVRVSQFIDELLVKLYGSKPFYKVKSKDDLLGQLVIGLAPHISCGMIGRIIGFSSTQAFFAHPMYHAALRRDCDGDEACVILLMDALLNFSRQFLPDKRGSRTMDAPLVLSSILLPTEVDDQVHGLDVVWRYPLEFYHAVEEFKDPWEVKITQLRDRLQTELQYEDFGYTHPVKNINQGITCSAYKTIPSMEDKLRGQMEIAERIRAVNPGDVARLIIEKHFLKDIKGNLRKFSMQKFRCVQCNAKYRRPPLLGRCTACGGKLLFTISEGSVVKYLTPSISLAEKYNVPSYLKQTLVLTKRRVEELFGKDKEVQEGLGKWFG